jgi:hypothetical protein
MTGNGIRPSSSLCSAALLDRRDERIECIAQHLDLILPWPCKDERNRDIVLADDAVRGRTAIRADQETIGPEFENLIAVGSGKFVDTPEDQISLAEFIIEPVRDAQERLVFFGQGNRQRGLARFDFSGAGARQLEPMPQFLERSRRRHCARLVITVRPHAAATRTTNAAKASIRQFLPIPSRLLFKCFLPVLPRHVGHFRASKNRIRPMIPVRNYNRLPIHCASSRRRH